MGEADLQPGERIDSLIDGRLRIIQRPQVFCFSLDAVLLADFVTVKPGEVICDLGTGTGVIPLLLSAWTRASRIYGLEIQAEMVEMSRRSVVLNGLEDRVSLELGDLRQASTLLGSGRFDVVVSNPPYYPPNGGSLNRVDARTISRHEVLCRLDDVVAAAGRLVRSRGRFALVHKPDRLTDILVALRSCRLEPKRLRVVYPRAGQKPNGLLVEALKDGGPGLEILNPLYIYEANGEYTAELRDIYYGKREPAVGTEGRDSNDG